MRIHVLKHVKYIYSGLGEREDVKTLYFSSQEKAIAYGTKLIKHLESDPNISFNSSFLHKRYKCGGESFYLATVEARQYGYIRIHDEECDQEELP